MKMEKFCRVLVLEPGKMKDFIQWYPKGRHRFSFSENSKLRLLITLISDSDAFPLKFIKSLFIPKHHFY